jgi:hypothetical protein
MPSITQNADGEFEMPMANGRVAVSDSREALAQMATEIVTAKENDGIFLE